MTPRNTEKSYILGAITAENTMYAIPQGTVDSFLCERNASYKVGYGSNIFGSGNIDGYIFVFKWSVSAYQHQFFISDSNLLYSRFWNGTTWSDWQVLSYPPEMRPYTTLAGLAGALGASYKDLEAGANLDNIHDNGLYRMGSTISGTLPDGVSTSQTYRGTLFVQQTILSGGRRWSGFQIAVFGAANASYIRMTDPGADNTWYPWSRCDTFGYSTLSGLASALGVTSKISKSSQTSDFTVLRDQSYSYRLYVSGVIIAFLGTAQATPCLIFANPSDVSIVGDAPVGLSFTIDGDYLKITSTTSWYQSEFKVISGRDF